MACTPECAGEEGKEPLLARDAGATAIQGLRDHMEVHFLMASLLTTPPSSSLFLKTRVNVRPWLSIIAITDNEDKIAIVSCFLHAFLSGACLTLNMLWSIR